MAWLSASGSFSKGQYGPLEILAQTSVGSLGPLAKASVGQLGYWFHDEWQCGSKQRFQCCSSDLCPLMCE